MYQWIYYLMKWYTLSETVTSSGGMSLLDLYWATEAHRLTWMPLICFPFSNLHQLKGSKTTTKSRLNWAQPCCDKHHRHHHFFLLGHYHHHPFHSISLLVLSQIRLPIQYQAMIQVLNQVLIQVLILTPTTLMLNFYVFAYRMNHSVNLLYI